MKQYLIKNSDIMHKGKIFPEGSTIELDEQEAISLSNYLVHSTLELEPKLKPSVLNSIQDQPKLEHKKRSK